MVASTLFDDSVELKVVMAEAKEAAAYARRLLEVPSVVEKEPAE